MIMYSGFGKKKNWKLSRYLLTGEWFSKFYFIVKTYSTAKDKNELLIFARCKIFREGCYM